MSSSNYFRISIEDIDGDLIDIEGDDRDGLVRVVINLPEGLADEYDTEAFQAEVYPKDARVLAAALTMASSQAEGNGIGIL